MKNRGRQGRSVRVVACCFFFFTRALYAASDSAFVMCLLMNTFSLMNAELEWRRFRAFCKMASAVSADPSVTSRSWGFVEDCFPKR